MPCNNQVSVLRSTLKWPEGNTQDVCAVCGKSFRVSERVAVVDRHFHEQFPQDGLYAHALCVQQECRNRGEYNPVKSYG